MKPDVEAAVIHLLNGLVTDGGHHKQWDIEQALISLKGEEWVESQRWVDEEGNVVDPDQVPEDEEVYEHWERGIPA